MKNLKWWLKWPLAAAAVIFILTLIAPLVPLGFLRPAVESRLSNMLGRKVSVGSLRLNLWGGPYLTINGMTANEDPAFGEGQFLKADKVQANFSLLKYIFQWQLVIEGLNVQSPDFTFIKNREGVWSWTTIGGDEPGAQTTARFRALPDSYSRIDTVIDFLAGNESRLSDVHVEGASVRLIDLSKEQPTETVYKNIFLHASVTTTYNGKVVAGRHAVGELKSDSSESEGVEILKASLPFDLNISRDQGSGLTVAGSVGPGPFQTRNFSANSFKIDLQVNSPRKAQTNPPQASASGLRGQGHISATDVVITGVNVSEKVAAKLQITSIGDMNTGTTIGGLETDFQIDQGIYRTPNLKIANLDGLGDAAAEQGWFTVESALTLNYGATLTLSDQITNQVKASSPIVGALVALIEINRPLAVSLNITGDVRSPQVSVDVLKTLGLDNIIK